MTYANLTDEQIRKTVAERLGLDPEGNAAKVGCPVTSWLEWNAPNWPSNIADAYQLVEDLHSKNFDVNIDLLAKWKLESGNYKYRVEIRQELPDSIEIYFYRVFAATAARAISEAWLMMMEEREER